LGGFYFPQGTASIATGKERAFVPGDGRMIFNPDSTVRAFQNENTIYLGGNMYYGHGIGIRILEGMIEALNESNPKKSASPSKQPTYIDLKSLPEKLLRK
jgi:protein-glutamine gamma-glutamyltransferase